MGNYVNSRSTNIIGMFIILITLGLGMKGVLSALGIF